MLHSRISICLVSLISLASFQACKPTDGGLQQQLKDTFLKKKGPTSVNGKAVNPSKQDLESQKNSIKSCPSPSKLRGAAYPAGREQWCAYTEKKGAAVRHGELRAWHKNGTLKVVTHYEDGELEGTFREWYPDGTEKENAIFTSGVRNGPTKKWYSDGKPQEVSLYKNGELDGLSTVYSKSGNIARKGIYKNDIENGVFEIYNKNGTLKEKTEFTKGIKHGRTKAYGRNGKAISQGFYNQGLKIGHWIFFSKRDGRKKSEGNFLNNKKHGKWIDYGKDGLPVRTTFYDQGRKLDSYRMNQRKNKTGSFGSTDILGDTPPRSRRFDSKSRNSSNKPKSTLREDAWKPL